MTYKELKQLKTSRGGSLDGSRVIITQTPRKKGYEKLKGCKGEIIYDGGAIDYGIRIDNIRNPRSSLDVFWIDGLNFEILDKEKENINMKNKGVVKWFNKEKGFGFITKEDGKDIFVHYKNLNMDGYKLLNECQKVEFDIETDNDNRIKAVNVTVVK